MKKVVKLNENDLENLVKKIIKEEGINEAWPKSELERKDTNFRRREFNPNKREKDLQSIFGKYSEDVPPNVIQYLRKNPSMIIKRLVDIYGLDRIQSYVDKVNR